MTNQFKLSSLKEMSPSSLTLNCKAFGISTTFDNEIFNVSLSSLSMANPMLSSVTGVAAPPD